MSEHVWSTTAADALARHGFSPAGLDYIGAGAQSLCYGTADVAVLLSRTGHGEQVPDFTGHVLPGSGELLTSNRYAALQWVTERAVAAGVRTPRILAVGELAQPYAIIERAHGTLASLHPAFAQRAVDWFGELGQEIQTTHLVRTSGFGLFVDDGATGYRGRYASWTDYLDRWLAVHLCVGESRPEDQCVLDLLLAQGIVSQHDFATVAAKVREAQAWPVRSVLTHYDNRAENLLVGAEGITVLDWGLALAGIGISQELIKLFETEPTSIKSPRVAAFLDGYGLDYAQSIEAVEQGKLMLVLDGLGMSYGWAGVDDRREGIRAWLRTIKGICDEW